MAASGALAAAAVGATLVGCAAPYDVVRITVRDPAQVAVAVGDDVVLAAGSDVATIPAAAFTHDPLGDATVERSARHGLVVDCPHCRGRVADRIFGGCADSALVDGAPTCLASNPPVIELVEPASAVRRVGDALRVGYTFADRVRGRRSSRQEPRIELDLVTPASNVVTAVVERRRHHPGDRATFELLFGVGVGYAALGAAMLGAGIAERTTPGEVAGGLVVAVGAVIAAIGWRSWHTPDDAWTLPVLP
jgi:hypothetical protein